MRIELTSLSLELDSRGHRTLKTINHALGPVIQACSVMDVYLIDRVDGFLPDLAEEIFLDPIAQRMYVDTSAVKDILPDWDLLIEITYKPGVTNP
ncbi:MAG: hypothetical protein KA771_04405 [Spirochaetales bacterium]|nr:hypothetical protein [Spirochaetales bacterium]